MTDGTADHATEPSRLDPDAIQAAALRRVLAGSTVVMVALSWRLWIDLADFPAIPFARWYPEIPRAWSPLGLLAILAGLGLSLSRRWGRAAMGVTAILCAGLALGDQLRFQAWVVQFLVMATLLAALPTRQAVIACRLYLISIYFYSGVSKLDRSFLDEMGPLFARTLARLAGVESRMPRSGASILWLFAMPVGEIVAAVLLLIPRTRRIGFAAVVVMHAVLLMILGPWGLGHTTIVLLWNVALVAEGYVVFWASGCRDDAPDHPTMWGKLVRAALVVVLLAPIGERWGLCDSWPGHALYASHCERTLIWIKDAAYQRLPDVLRLACDREPGGTEWRLSLTAWSRLARGVPTYPQIRYANGVAEWIALHLGPSEGAGGMRVAVQHQLRANPWTGRRKTLDARGLAQIHDLGETFWFRSHPRAIERR